MSRGRVSPPRTEHATAFALSLGLDQAADLRSEGFGWRVATDAFVARWQREQAELTAIGYRVCWNKLGEMLVMCWPVAKQLEDASIEAPDGFKTARAAPQRSPARLPDRAPARRERPQHKHRQAADNTVIVPGDGPPCPRCKRPTEIREHRQINDELLQRSSYYRRWFRCTHADCRTTLVMLNEFIVRRAAG